MQVSCLGSERYNRRAKPREMLEELNRSTKPAYFRAKPPSFGDSHLLSTISGQRLREAKAIDYVNDKSIFFKEHNLTLDVAKAFESMRLLYYY
ncbi:hypothetical protein J6590_016175 [Homalodisca vitripennis]|nr:hypothetical protein J6590_016175 [Homalodisca vitripennis]